MDLPRSTHIAFLLLFAFLFQTVRFIASAATVLPGVYLYVFEPAAEKAFLIADDQANSDHRMSNASDYCEPYRTESG
jgi:hypothetical protein